MTIDIGKYVEVVIGKIEKGDYYSELSSEELYSVIEKHLTEIYDKQVLDLAIKYNDAKDNGDKIDKKQYREEYNDIKRHILSESFKLAMTKKPKLTELSEL